MTIGFMTTEKRFGMKFLILAFIAFTSAVFGQRGDESGDSSQLATNAPHEEVLGDGDWFPENFFGEKEVIDKVKYHNSSLISLFGSNEAVKRKTYNNVDMGGTASIVKAYMYIKIAEANYEKVFEENKNNISEVLFILEKEILDQTNENGKNLFMNLINDGIMIAKTIGEEKAVQMISDLWKKVNNPGDSCTEYSEDLISVWWEIVEEGKESEIHKYLNIMVDIIEDVFTYRSNGDTSDYSEMIRDKTQILALFSTEKNAEFAKRATGGIQPLEDLMKDILCSRGTLLNIIGYVLSKISLHDNLADPSDISTLVEFQTTLTQLTSSLQSKQEGVLSMKTTMRDLQKGVLSKYMEIADKAVSVEKASAWAKMSLEDASMKLHEMLLTNEKLVGAVSSLVPRPSEKKQNDVENYTLEEESITVSISRLNLTTSTASHAEFNYENTIIKTENWENEFDKSEGDDLRVYTLRYKSWSEMIDQLLEQHFKLGANLSSSNISLSRKRRSLDSQSPGLSYDKSFIGKGGVISLSTQQQGKKKSLPVLYWIGFENTTSLSSSQYTQCLSCEYLDSSTLAWETNGCQVYAVDEYGITCKCNHTTNFAAFMMPVEITYELTEEMEEVLRWISIIGSSLSVAGLLLSLAVFFLVRRLVRNERLKAHTHLSIALLLVNILFLGSDLFIQNESICVATTILSHYFLLTSFFWMLIEGIFLYLYVIQVFLRSKIDSYSWMYLMGWGVPIIIVAISAGFGLSHDIYVMPKQNSENVVTCPEGTIPFTLNDTDRAKYERCWLSTESGMIWSFLGPAIAIVIFNTIIMSRTLKICVESMRNSANMKSRANSFPSSVKYSSSASDNSYEMSRSIDSYNQLHGQQTKSAPSQPTYAVSTSPCLLQVTTDEEEKQNCGSGSNETPITRASNSVASSPGQTRYHSVSGDSARIGNNRTASVVYRNSVSHSTNTQVKSNSFANKMAQLTETSHFLRDAKAAVKGAIVLLPILGIPWILGSLAHLSLVFTFLFIILNSTQGVFIFIVYCIKNGEVRRAMQRRMHTRSLKNSLDAGIRRSSSASTARSFLRFGRRRSTVLTTT